MEFKDWDLTKDFFQKDSFELKRTQSQEMKDSAAEITTNSRRKEVTEKDYMTRTKDLMLKHNQLRKDEAKYHAIKDMLNTNPEEEPLPIFKKRKMKTQTCGRPKAFGGDLDDMYEATGNIVPAVLASCIDAIRRLGMKHQGIFRIGGAQADIDQFEKDFKEGKDPFHDLEDDFHMNSVSGILKMWFRKLPEPIFSNESFDYMMSITKNCLVDGIGSISEKIEKGRGLNEPFVSEMREVVKQWNPAKREAARLIFKLLSDLSENSSVTNMDPFNIAICWGPNLAPIPKGHDLVAHTSSVNNLIKNFIVFSSDIFASTTSSRSPHLSRNPSIRSTKSTTITEEAI